METIVITTPQTQRTLTRELAAIIPDITWGNIAKKYMGKSPSWIYNKLQGRNGNGGTGGFTPEETERLREALLSFSREVEAAALRI